MAKVPKKVGSFILVALFGLAMDCYGLSVDELITKVQRNYDQISDILARFAQEYIHKSLNRVFTKFLS